MAAVLDVAGSIMLLGGLAIMTIGLLGTVRHGSVYVQLHAASKAVVLGVVLVLAASIASGDGQTIARAALISGFLLLTTPLATHAIGRAVWMREHDADPDQPGRD